MHNASIMNTNIVNNALEANHCPQGYVEVGNKTDITKDVRTSYREDIGRSGRTRSGLYPHAESRAEDRTSGRGRIKCERIQ
jgi:hypothetical protein